jgi:hypothetical protein
MVAIPKSAPIAICRGESLCIYRAKPSSMVNNASAVSDAVFL